MKKYLLAPSIMAADFSKLGEEATKVLTAGGDLIHFDMMDNHYVPNLTMGPIVLKALRNYGVNAPIDVHLMVKPVDNLIPKVAKSGATYITFHPESTEHIDRTIQLIKEHGCKAGLAFNPTTSISYLKYIIDKLDIILIMSVNPGFSGQLFIPSILDKIRTVREYINKNNHDVYLEVDGGVNLNNINKISEAGANIFVIGSAIFSHVNYELVIDNIRNKLKEK